MSDLRVVMEEGHLCCSECGTLADPPEESMRKASAWDHLLDRHRARLVSASSEVAVAKVEAMR